MFNKIKPSKHGNMNGEREREREREKWHTVPSMIAESVRKSKTSVQYRQALAFPYFLWHSS